MLISKSLADTNGALTLWQHFFFSNSPVQPTRVSYVPRNRSVAKDYLLGAKIRVLSDICKILGQKNTFGTASGGLRENEEKDGKDEKTEIMGSLSLHSDREYQ